MIDITVYTTRSTAGLARYSFDPPLASSVTHRVIPPAGWIWSGSGRCRLIRSPSGELTGPCRSLALARRGLAGFRLGDPNEPVAELGRDPIPDGWGSDAGLAPTGDVF